MPITKLSAPTITPEVVVADHLVERVRASLATNRLTTIVAPGGSGKTTLAAVATATIDAPAAWVRLHPTDDDPRMLVELAAAAVDHVAPGATAATRDLLRTATARDLEPTRLLGTLINELAALSTARDDENDRDHVDAGDEPSLVLVADDAHTITSEPGAAVLQYLVEFGPPGMRVITTSRGPLAIPLARLRTTVGVGELDADDLRLDADTAAAMLARRDIDPTPDLVASLLERTNGWTAGFLLGATSHGTTGHGNRTGSSDAVTEYLADEIVGTEPPETQRFLRAVSILDDLDPARCAAITGVDDAHGLLADLRRRLGPFVVERGGRLELHDLLLEHLRLELERHATADELAELHRRAADTADEPLGRIEHLVTAGDHERAGDELQWFADPSRRPPAVDARIVGLVERLDADERHRRPALDLMVAEHLAHRGDPDAAAELLASVRERLDDGERDDEHDFALRWSATLASAHITHDIERWAPVLFGLEHDDRFDTLPTAARVGWVIGTAWASLWSGEPERAGDRIDAALAIHRDEPSLPSAEVLAVHLGFPLAVRPRGVEQFVAHHRSALDRFGDVSWVVRSGSRAQLHALDVIRGAPPIEPGSTSEAALATGHDAGHATGLATGHDAGHATGHDAGLDRILPHSAIALDFARAARARAAGDHHTVHAVVAPLVEPPARGFGLLLAPLLAGSYREQGLADDIERLVDAIRTWPGGPPGRPALDLVTDLVAAEASWARGRLDDAERGFAAAIERHGRILTPVVVDPGVQLALVRHEQGRTAEATSLLAGRIAELAGRLESPGRVALSGPQLVPLLERLAGGDTPAAARVLALLGHAPAPGPRSVPSTGETLTGREVEVLALITVGATNAELAERLHVSNNTVKTHVRRVLAKLAATSRAEAAAIARRDHLV